MRSNVLSRYASPALADAVVSFANRVHAGFVDLDSQGYLLISRSAADIILVSNPSDDVADFIAAAIRSSDVVRV